MERPCGLPFMRTNFYLNQNRRCPVNYDHIETAEQLALFCNDVKGSKFIGFDTEFVSEDIILSFT